MHTLTVYGPGFRVVFTIDADRTHAVRMATFKKHAGYAGGWQPAGNVQTSRAHAAHTLRVAHNRADCQVETS